MMWYRRLHWQILIGMGAGVVVGSLIGDNVRYVQPVGEIFLRLLRMVIVPLIFSSLVVGVSLILAVDRILDMCRTSVNVWSDTVGAAVISRGERYPIERTMGSQPD
jgi:Na+/H+-dicarboxylate symporter